MEQVLATARKVQLRERGRVAEALTASLREGAAAESLSAARTSGRNGAGGETALHFMFYCPQADDFLINRAVAAMTRQSVFMPGGEKRDVLYAHVELSFPTDPAGAPFADGRTMGFSITQTSHVYMRLKTWREEYHTVVVYVPVRAYAALFHECVRVATQDIGFDHLGMYMGNIAPSRALPTRTRGKHGTYCSKIITELLQQFGVAGQGIRALDARSCNPNTIFMALQAP